MRAGTLFWMALVRTLVVACGMIAATAPADSDIDATVRGVMTRYLKFGATELAQLEGGAIVKHSIESSAPGELAVAGAVRVHAPKARLLEQVRDIERFKRGPEIIQIGRFSNPPVIGDLASLTITKEDFDPHECRVGNCDARLPADVIRNVARDVGDGPDAQARAATLFKRVLLDNVKAYFSGGAGRFVQYDHGDKPIRPVDEFEGILKNAPAIGALVPGLPQHLATFPANRVDGAEDFLYWSKEKFGMGPFVSVTHVTIVCRSPQLCVITTKDVYSSHFIDASLSLTIAADAVGVPDAFYLVYANRSRATALKGWLSGLRQSIADRRARSGLETTLRTVKSRLERGR